jgi:prepilin-type N-terminal cleavage/methylation domain-containing protein
MHKRNNSNGPSFDRRAGVTMVEMLIVLVLIGILTMMAMPRLDATVFRMRAATQSLGSALLAAQRTAVARQHDVVITFELAQNRIRIHQDANNDGVVDDGEGVRVVPLEDGAVFGRGHAPSYQGHTGTISLTNGASPALTFKRDGSASQEVVFYITSTRAAAGEGRPSDSRVFIISRATGRTSWLQPRGSEWRREF